MEQITIIKNNIENPFDFFKEIWCINLDHRKDRWEHCTKEFEGVNILTRIQRFSAIKHEDGRIGLIYSYIKLFEHAQEKNLENILIFEDDVKFINNPTENLKLALEQIDSMDWSLLYFGSNIHKKINKVTQNLLRLKQGYATHAIAYHKSIYEPILSKFKIIHEIKNKEDVYDVHLSNLQNMHPCFIINPIIATQYNSYSDIEKKHAKNESMIENRFKKCSD